MVLGELGTQDDGLRDSLSSLGKEGVHALRRVNPSTRGIQWSRGVGRVGQIGRIGIDGWMVVGKNGYLFLGLLPVVRGLSDGPEKIVIFNFGNVGSNPEWSLERCVTYGRFGLRLGESYPNSPCRITSARLPVAHMVCWLCHSVQEFPQARYVRQFRRSP